MRLVSQCFGVTIACAVLAFQNATAEPLNLADTLKPLLEKYDLPGVAGANRSR